MEERLAWKKSHTLAGRERIGYLWRSEGGKCQVCRQPLQVEEQPWHVHHRVWRCFGGQETFDNLGVENRGVENRTQLVSAQSRAASVRPTNGPWKLYGFVKNVNKVTALASMSISSPTAGTR